MKKWFVKEDLPKIRPWLLLSVLVILFYLGVSNFTKLLAVFDFLLDLFQPLLLAIAFAYILNIPMMFIERRIQKKVKRGGVIDRNIRGISLTLTILLAIVFIVFIGSIVVPRIVESFIQLFNNIGMLLQNIFDNIDEIFAFFHLEYRLISVLGDSANGIWTNAMSVTSTFFLWFMAFMFSLYLLSGKETLLRQLRRAIIALFKEKKAAVLFDYSRQANAVFKSFITGQLMEACIIGILYYVTMRLFRFPYPELIAVMIALFSLVPVFGPMCAMVIGAFLILSENVLSAVWFMVYFQLLSQLEDNLIYPRIVGKSVGLPGLWVMLSIFILGDLFGIVGMVTAVPLTAFFYTLFAGWVRNTLQRRHVCVDEDGYVIEKDK